MGRRRLRRSRSFRSSAAARAACPRVASGVSDGRLPHRRRTSDEPDNVIELGSAGPHALPRRAHQLVRPSAARDRARGLGALPRVGGRDLRGLRAWISTTPGTRDTPERFLRALFEATAGYDGDPKLATTFPAEGIGARRGGAEPDHRGPDRVPLPLRAPRAAVLRHRAHRLHRRRADHRHLEADAARAAVRAAVHGSGAARRADRRRARLARSRRAGSPSTSRRRTSARRCAASRSSRGR